MALTTTTDRRDEPAAPEEHRLRGIQLHSLAGVAVAFCICFAAVAVVAGVCLWLLADVTGVTGRLERFLAELAGDESYEVSAARLLAGWSLLVLVWAAIAVGVIVAMGAMFNVVANRLGGVAVTMTRARARTTAVPTTGRSLDREAVVGRRRAGDPGLSSTSSPGARGPASRVPAT